MGRLIEQQAVIDCLTNTAKYYEREDADEWTKGIHYGLLHGVDNILDNVPTVEAIPKADYETRLKADLKAMLEDLDLKIDEMYEPQFSKEGMDGFYWAQGLFKDLVQEEINALRGGRRWE